MNKTRPALCSALVISSVICLIAGLQLNAASPTAGSISPTSKPVTWMATATGGASNGEDTCVEGVNCDTFKLTVTGTPADWAGKKIEVTISWVVLANDYDLFIHKGSNSGPVVSSSAHGAPGTQEVGKIDPAIDGTGVFSVHVTYFTGSAADGPHGVARVVAADAPPPPPPPVSPNWTINYHGTCCEGNLAASGKSTYMLLPVLVNGNKIVRSDDGGKTWVQKYPPADVSVPFGIEGDMQAFGDDVIFFGTELGDAVVAHSDDRAETFRVTHTPVASAGNDQAWSYLGPFGDLRPGGALPTDEPYVLAGWFRIGASVVFSFDGGLTFPLQSPLVGDDGSGPMHVVCRNNAHDPTNAGDTRISNPMFAKHKAGRHGTWGTDRKFYWTEPANDELYVCKTDDFGATWTGIKHPIEPGPGSSYVVSHSAFDQKGTLYVLHGNKLYVSFNQGENMAFVHTLPRYGNAQRSDSGADQFFVVDNGTIHIGLIEDGGEGRGRIYYLRGRNVDTAQPQWDEELVDIVGNERLDFMQIILNGNGIPTISYTTPGDKQVTTASRNAPMPIPGPRARLLNISTRALVKTADQVAIGGFIISGSAPRPVIVRALGPSLNVDGKPIDGRLQDPVLQLYREGKSTPIETNDNWRQHEAEVKATGLAPSDKRESAIVRTLEPGHYTAIVRGANDATGIALVEAYDLGSDATGEFANLSTRGFVGKNDNIMIGGFIAGPPTNSATRIVVRGLGPSLKKQVPAALPNPTLELRDRNGALIDQNDDWQQSTNASEIDSVGLAPRNKLESALLVPALQPGEYTALLRATGNKTGIGLVEIYNLP